MSSFHIRYASKSGNGESIAKMLYSKLKETKQQSSTTEGSSGSSCAAEITLQTINSDKKALPEKIQKCLDEVSGTEDTAEQDVYIYIVSTTGDGDLPENGDLGYRKLRRLLRSLKKKKDWDQKKEKLSKHFEFYVLALGDSNYSQFCGAGRKVYSVLNDLGWTAHPRREADDATGLAETVEPFMKDMVEALKKKSSSSEDQSSSDGSQNSPSPPTTSEPSSNVGPTTSNSNSLSTPKAFDSSSTPVKPTIPPKDGNDTSPQEPLSPVLQAFRLKRSRSPTPLHTTPPATPSQQLLTYVPIIESRLLTHPKCSKKVLHFSLNIKQSPKLKSYQPGDAIGILAPNSKEKVNWLLKRLEIENPDSLLDLHTLDEQLTPKHIEFPNSVRFFLEHKVDISGPVNHLTLKMLAQFCRDPQEKKTINFLRTTPGRVEYLRRVTKQHASLLDMLERFPSCLPPIQMILQVLPALQPRFYSISSSPLKYPEEIHFACTIVDWVTPPPFRKQKRGVCTDYLWRQYEALTQDDQASIALPIYLKPLKEFKVPQSLSTPLIMIGPGTGISPFRSFLQHREEQMGSGNMKKEQHWLFHGCRSRELDFLYGEEMEKFHKNNQLNLLVASSRDNRQAIWYGGQYVQDNLMEYGSDIVSLMEEQKAYLYICGDAQSMVKDVDRVLIGVLMEEMNQSSKEAAETLRGWKSEGRYQIDAW